MRGIHGKQARILTADRHACIKARAEKTDSGSRLATQQQCAHLLLRAKIQVNMLSQGLLSGSPTLALNPPPPCKRNLRGPVHSARPAARA